MSLDRVVRPDCPVCFGTGWQPTFIGSEWVKWPCQKCIKAERAASDPVVLAGREPSGAK